MNFKIVSKYLGILMVAEALLLLPSLVVCLIYGEDIAARAFLATAALCVVLGAGLFLPTRKASTSLYARESFVVAGGGWLFISLLGALPFFFSGEIPVFIDAVFESVSGFTTTGASMVEDIEAMSNGLLFWRCFSSWLGGIGILVFILALMRTQTGAGFTVHLLRAESSFGKIKAKTRDTVRIICVLYLQLTAIIFVFLLVGRMPVFDALCTSFGVASTGGFAIKNDSLGSYSVYIQTVVGIFMALAGISFTMYHLLMRKDWKSLVKDNELRLYLGIILGAGLAMAISLLTFGGHSPMDSFGQAFFTSSSVLSSTTFTISDFNNWPQFCKSLLLVMMVFGGMSGSTSSGFKISRVLIILNSIKAGLHKLLHPRSVKAVKINGKTVDANALNATMLYLCVYCAIAIVSFLLLSVDGNTLETNISAVVSTLNNVGPGFGSVGITDNYSYFSIFSKIILIANMLLGRLEIFPILLLLSPSTWRRKT